MGLFTDWLKGPEDNSLEGRRRKVTEARGDALRRQYKLDRASAAADRRAEREATSGVPEVSPNPPAEQEGGRAPAASPTQSVVSREPAPIQPQAPQATTEQSPLRPRIGQFIDRIGQLADKTGGDKLSQQVTEFLGSGKSREYLENYLDKYLTWRGNIPSMMENTRFDPNDMDGSIEKLLLNNLNMVKGADGLYREKPRSSKADFLMAGASVPGEGRGEPRFLLYDEILGLLKNKDMLQGAEDGDASSIQKQMLLNNVDWDTAKRWYGKLPRDLQTSLNGNGSPTGEILDAEGIEFFPDPDNEDGEGFSGYTNVDEDQDGFSDQVTDNRGIFLLQKILAQGGLDTMSGLPLHGLSQKYTTIDHLQGRSTNHGDRKFKMESPVNMGVVRRGLNQNKVSSGRKGTPSADTIGALLKGAAGKKLAGRALKKELKELGISDSKDTIDSDLLESPHFMRYVMSLIGDNSHHFDDFSEQVQFTRDMDAPASVKDVIGLAQQGNEFGDEFGLRKFLANPNYLSEFQGLDLANMAMIMPRPRDYEGNLEVPNTWRGSPGGGNEYEGALSPLKMALLSNLFVNPEVTGDIDAVSDRIKRDGFNLPNMSTPDGKILQSYMNAQKKLLTDSGQDPEEVKEKMKQLKSGIKGSKFDMDNPDHKLLHDLILRNMRQEKAYKQGGRAMRALGANYAFGNDDLDNQSFVSKLTDLGLSKMQFLKDIDPEGYAELEEMLLDKMSDYRTALDDKLPGGPIPRGEEIYKRLLKDNKGQAVAKQMAATRLGRGYMTPGMVQAYLARKFNSPVPEQVPTDQLEEGKLLNFTEYIRNLY